MGAFPLACVKVNFYPPCLTSFSAVTVWSCHWCQLAARTPASSSSFFLKCLLLPVNQERCSTNGGWSGNRSCWIETRRRDAAKKVSSSECVRPRIYVVDVMVAGWIRRGICDITPLKSSGEFGQKRRTASSRTLYLISFLLLPSPPPPPADLFVGGPRRFRLAPFHM